jgi:hypothetical protein
MKPDRWMIVGAWLLAASLLRADHGAEPAAGRVLLLENERTLEGDIVREGEHYVIRRAIGETRLPREKAQRLCANLEEAFHVLKARANLRDPDERLRLARWCLVRGLRAQAQDEAAATVALRPDHPEGQRLLHNLRQAEPAAAPSRADAAALAESLALPFDYNPESLGLFTTKVQPILMNTCASCHGGERGGSFKLVRAIDDGMVNRRATQQNLAAVLRQVHPERPLASPLLLKAVAVHAPDADHPPIKNRQAIAYRMLEEWVKLAVAHPRKLVESGRLGGPPAVAPRWPTQPSATPASSFAAGTEPSPPPPPAPAAEPQPLPPPPPADEFDPAIFNQQAHRPR